MLDFLYLVVMMPLHAYMTEGYCHLLAHVEKECLVLLLLIIFVQCTFMIV